MEKDDSLFLYLPLDLEVVPFDGITAVWQTSGHLWNIIVNVA